MRAMHSFLLMAGVALAVLPPGTAAADPIPATVDQPVTIKFYNYNLATAGIGADATRKLIAEFMAANPNVSVDAVGVPGPEVASRIQADLAAGAVAELAQVAFGDLDFLVNTIGAVALEDIVPSDELSGHFEGMSLPGLQLGVLDGKTYGLAYTFSTPVLYYNADLFRAAGLDPDRPPATWDEVAAAGAAIVEKTGKQGVYVGGVTPLVGDWLWHGVVLSNGGQVLSDDRSTLMFAEPAAVGAAQMMRGLAQAGLMQNLGFPALMDAMASGSLGMMLNSSALNAALEAAAKDKWELRAAPMPSFGDRPAAPTNSGGALFILTDDPVKQRAAWELMKFLTSERGYTIITSEIGYVPLRPGIVDDPAHLKDWADAHPMVRINLDQLPQLRPWVSMPGPQYRQIQRIMMDAVEESVFGDNPDIAAILAEAQARAQDLIPVGE